MALTKEYQAMYDEFMRRLNRDGEVLFYWFRPRIAKIEKYIATTNPDHASKPFHYHWEEASGGYLRNWLEELNPIFFNYFHAFAESARRKKNGY